METTVKPAPRSTDRLVEALSTLAGLLDRTINEVKTLDTDFQNRLLQSVHDTESSLQQQASEHLERALQEAAVRIRSEVTEEMKLHFEREMTAAVQAVRAELDAERQKLSVEVDRATKAAAQWEADRSNLQNEVAEAKKSVDAARAEKDKAVAEAKPAGATAGTSTEKLLTEVTRVESLIQTISTLIDDPATELSTVIRKNVERAELQSYLKGIRFAVNGK